jgi:SAM-dependent methyltransferase
MSGVHDPASVTPDRSRVVRRAASVTPYRSRVSRLAVACLIAALLGFTVGVQAGGPALRKPDVRFEPTPADVVEVMLNMAKVGPGDVVYDLGCGDGRIVIAAARRGARGVCVDIDPVRIRESRENARAAGLAGRIEFRNEDLLKTGLSDATVVMLFLSSRMNLALRPRLGEALAPGARIVSHWHDMGDWEPRETAYVLSEGYGRPVYLWVVPQR